MMSGSTRRNFLIASGAAGVVAAVATTAGASPLKAGTPAAAAPLTTPDGAQPLVAHISDPSSGQLTLLVGDQEVQVSDPDLVARITRAATRKG